MTEVFEVIQWPRRRRVNASGGRRVVRNAKTLALCLALTAVLGMVVVEAATASCTQGANSGSGALGPVGSASGAASWNASSRHFTLHAAADSGLASGICADAWYDWLTVGGDHYDARVARTCQAGSTRYADGTDGYTEPSNSVSFRSMQKFSVCRSNGADMQNELIECRNSGCAYQGAEGNVIPNLPNKCTRGWVRNRSGDTDYFAGGDPTDCSA
jgi:hypothetical protein